MGDVTRVLVGLEDFEVAGAVETAAGVLEVSVRVARPDAACPRCGTFSSRVEEYRTCRVRDGLSYERPTTCAGSSVKRIAPQRQSPGLSNSVTCGFTNSPESTPVHRGTIYVPHRGVPGLEASRATVRCR